MTEQRWADVRGLRTDGSVAAIEAVGNALKVTAPAATPTVFGTAAIGISGTLSGPVVIAGAVALWIEVPTWTSAAITFTGNRAVGAGFLDVYDELGVEVIIPAGTHNALYAVPALLGLYSVQVRSGISGTTVTQAAARTNILFGLS